MDKLKQYIEQNKAHMDVDQPPGRVWESISENRKQQAVNHPVYHYATYAAAALLVLLAGAGIWLATRRDSNSSQAGTVVNQMPTQNEIVPKDNGIDTATANLSNGLVVGQKEKKVQKQINRKSFIRVPNDLESIDKTYSRLVNHQLERLRATPVYAEEPEYFTRFVTQLIQMNHDEETIKKEMKQFGLNDRLLEGLISIYQEKLNLLKTLQKEIGKMNDMVKKDESKENWQAYYLNL